MTKDEALKLALEALKMCRGVIRNNIENLVPIESPNPWFSQDVDRAITAIREALAEPEIPMQNNNPGLEWDKIPKSFDDWWDSDYDPTGNPFQHETPAYWAWAGWKASSVATNDISQYRVDETAKQRHEAQPEHSCVACEGNPKGNNNPCAVCGLAQPDVDRRSTESKETFDQQEPVAMYEDWYNPKSCGHCGMVGGHTKICRHYTTPPSNSMNSIKPSNTLDAHRKPLSDEEEREAFEDYALRTICNPVELQRKRLSGYGSEELNYLWRGWKARAAHGIKE